MNIESDKKSLYVFSSLLLSFLIFFSCKSNKEALYWYCAASLKAPALEITREFNKKGNKLFLIQGGSGQLLQKIIASGKGDFYTSAGLYFRQKANEKKIVKSEIPLVEQQPVFAFAPGKKPLKNLELLGKSKYKIALGNAKTMALGKIWLTIEKKMPSLLKKNIRKRVFVSPINISQTLNYLKTKTVDAALLFDSVARLHKLSYIQIPSKYGEAERAFLMELKYSSNKKNTSDFIKFVQSHKSIFKKYGFTIVK